jgi:hypothetical protein
MVNKETIEKYMIAHVLSRFAPVRAMAARLARQEEEELREKIRKEKICGKK